jgi:hypothetical protein
MMTDRTTNSGTRQTMMPRHMSDHPTNDCTLDTPSGESR